MKEEKIFMMIFRLEPNTEYQPTQDELNKQHQSWGKFIGNIAIQEKLVSTHQLGFEGKVLSADLSISEGVNIADRKTLGGNMIVRANSIDEAMEMAKDCPILHIGGTVEVRNIIPMEA